MEGCKKSEDGKTPNVIISASGSTLMIGEITMELRLNADDSKHDFGNLGIYSFVILLLIGNSRCSTNFWKSKGVLQTKPKRPYLPCIPH